ncbi:hypothetical protein ABW20_dc0109861 [Dactylellina cionopaga]|nr:hypothetical protein ABW20_dc0109861 [Dactylellina cionopaga]
MPDMRTELIAAGLAEAGLGDASFDPQCDPKSFEPPKLDIKNSICMVEVTDTGSIGTFDFDSAQARLSSPKLNARIFIVSGSEDPQEQLAPWISVNPAVWPRFFQAHLDGDENLQGSLQQKNTGIFFFNWGRLASQSKEQYEIGKRILAKKPYNIGAIGDPLPRNLGHKRYYQWPDRPYRKYDMISSSEDDTVLYHAAKECVSFYSETVDGVFTGI